MNNPSPRPSIPFLYWHSRIKRWQIVMGTGKRRRTLGTFACRVCAFCELNRIIHDAFGSLAQCGPLRRALRRQRAVDPRTLFRESDLINPTHTPPRTPSSVNVNDNRFSEDDDLLEMLSRSLGDEA